MHFRTTLFIALIASPLPALAACKSTRSVSEEHNQEARILVPFAVPIGLPVAPFAPYFYSASQFQPPRTNNLAHTPTDNGPLTTDKGPTTDNLISTRCASCHRGPTP